MARAMPSVYANLVAIVLAFTALAAFVMLPWVGAKIPEVPLVFQGADYEATGMETINYLYLWSTSADKLTEALDKAGLDFMMDVMGEINFAPHKTDYYVLGALPALFLVVITASGVALAVPDHAQTLRWGVLGCGVLVVLLTLSWGYRLDVITFGRIGFWIVAVCGILIVAQALVPREEADPASRKPARAGAWPHPAVTPPPVRYPSNAMLVEMNTGRQYLVYRGRTTIGRSSTNDIVVAGGTVSREHVMIHEENGSFTLYDRASRMGTRVNGQRVGGPMPLRHGDQVVLGDSANFQFRCPGEKR